MPISNYPNGFASGVNIRGLPLLNTYGGSVFWVDSGAGSDQNKGTFDRPLATIDKAFDTGFARANKGDIVMVKPGHTESVATDGGIACDVAGVSIVGLGTGADRPTITVETLAAAAVVVSAANVSFHNLLFLGNLAALVACLEIAGDSCEVSHCEFRESTLGMITAITIGVADGDADYCHIHDSKFFMDEPGITNVGDAAIEIIKDSDHITIGNNHIYGDFDDAGISVVAGGNACDFLVIEDNFVENTASGAHAIEVTTGGTMNGGAILNNRLVSDALGTLLEPHTLQCLGNRGSIGTTNSADFPIPSFAGERAIRIARKITGDMSSGYGTAQSPVTLFTVTGDVMVRLGASIDVTVTSTSDTGTLEAGVAGNIAGLLVQDVVTAADFAAGDSWTLLATAIVNGGQMADEWLLVGNGADIILTIATNNMTAGDIDFYCEWYPLSETGNVVAA